MHILNIIWTFIAQYWLDVLLVAGVIVFAAVQWRRGKRAQVLNLARQAVIAMEEKWSGDDGSGAFKKIEALNWLYLHMPKLLKMFLTEKQLDDMIEQAWSWMIAALYEKELKYDGQ